MAAAKREGRNEGAASPEAACRLAAPRARAVAWIVAGVAIATYANTLAGDFTFDDTWILLQNPLVQDLGRLGDLLTSPYWGDRVSAGLYRPITSLTFAVQSAVHGMTPLGFHVVNVILHAVASVLVGSVARRLSGSEFVATASGLLFAAHPIHTEAVAGIVGRAEILATCGVLIALRAALDVHSPRARSRIVFGLGVVLAMFSKEIGIVAFPLLVAMSFGRRDRVRDAWALVGIAAFVAVALIIAKLAVTGAIGVPVESISRVANPAAHVEATSRIATAFAVLANYAGLLVFPDILSFDYSLSQVPITTFENPKAWIGMLLVVSIAVAAVALRRRVPAAACGCVVFLVAWFPVSNLVAPIGTIQAERLLYLPSVGFVWCVAELVRRVVGERPRVAWGIVWIVTVALAGRAVVRNFDWRDNRALFESGIVTSPRSALTHFELGKLLFNEARTEEDERERTRLERRSAELFEKGLSIAPEGDAVALLGLAYLHERRGETAAAFDRFGRSRRTEPGLAASWIGEMGAAARLGRVDAVREIAKAMLEEGTAPGSETFAAPVWAQAATITQAVGLVEVTAELRARAARVASRNGTSPHASSP